MKQGYKQTDVGVIPQDWNVKTVGEFNNVKTGPFGSALHQKDYVEDGTPIITVEHLGEQGVLHHNLPMVSDKDKIRLSAYLLEKQDIVFSRVGSVDRNSMITIFEDGWLFSGRLLRLRPNKGECNAKYLSYYFHHEPTKQRIRGVAVGQTMPSLNTQILKDIKVALPPTLAEQTAIAAALSDMDNLIAGLEQLIAKKKAIKQGAMQELLRPKEGWSQEPIKSIALISTGAKNTQDKIENGIYPFFVRSEVVERINSYSFDGEAVLVAGDGVGTGKVIHYAKGKFDYHQRVYKISDFQSNIHGFFFYLFFKNNFLSRIMQMTAKSSVDSVRREMIADMIIHFPDFNEQERIAYILRDMNDEIMLLESNLDKYKLLKQGMMQELLTGKTRLV
ncbi:restriction endonuclease subunit S [Phnomibacter sp. MR]|uniref:restriction endonuclease subunit S n=1 Tax=Phnomibacter sp. MR TaxID=3042318 RepID=UPI003A7F70A7